MFIFFNCWYVIDNNRSMTLEKKLNWKKNELIFYYYYFSWTFQTCSCLLSILHLKIIEKKKELIFTRTTSPDTHQPQTTPPLPPHEKAVRDDYRYISLEQNDSKDRMIMVIIKKHKRNVIQILNIHSVFIIYCFMYSKAKKQCFVDENKRCSVLAAILF